MLASTNAVAIDAIELFFIFFFSICVVLYFSSNAFLRICDCDPTATLTQMFVLPKKNVGAHASSIGNKLGNKRSPLSRVSIDQGVMCRIEEK